MSRKAIKGVLHNFLETYTSRYSDYDGYWLFGMLVSESGEINIDLLNATGDWVGGEATASAVRLASMRFKEQMAKAGLDLSCLREARLSITRTPGLRDGYVNGHRAVGSEMNFAARAVSLHGKAYECKKSVFVAPHNPEVELRSTRGT